MKNCIKTLFLISFLLFCLSKISILYADDSLDDFPTPLGAEWAQLFPEASGRSIVATSSGYVVAGRQNGPDSSPLLDYWTILVSYGTDGTSGPYKTFDTDDDHNEAFDIIASYDGGGALDGYIIAGAKHQEFIEGEEEYYNPYMWLMKTGTDLERDWEYTFGDPYSDYGYSVYNDGDGFILSGEYTTGGAPSAYLVRTNESGVITWEACWATDPRWVFSPVTYDSTPGIGGGLVVATDGGLYKLGTYTTSSRPSDTPVWSASTTDILKSVITVPDGYVATGYVEISGDTTHNDLVLLKVNEDGSLAWRHTFGRSAPALGTDGMDDYGEEVIQTADGGFVVIGTTYSYAWHGESDMWLIKTDASGSMEWDIAAGDADNDFGKGIVQDSSNDLVACGTSYYDDGLGGGLTTWIYTVKFSNSYTPPNPSFIYSPENPFVWDTIHFNASGTTPGGAGNSILLYEWDFGDGNTGTGITADHIYMTPGVYDVTLYITDSNGIRREATQSVTVLGMETQWERSYGDGTDWFLDIVEGDGNNFLLCGYYGTSYNNSVWAMKFDGFGNVIWESLYPDTNYSERDGAQKGVLGNDGNYVLAGYSYKPASPVDKSDVRIIKIDSSNGDIIWDKFYNYSTDPEGDDKGIDIKTVPGGYIIVGYATTVPSLPTDVDTWLIKIDEDGNEEWNQTYSNTGSDTLRGMAVTPTSDGGYLILANKYGSISSCDLIAIKTGSSGGEEWRYTIPNEFSYKDTGGFFVHQNSEGDFVIAGILNNEHALITIASDGTSHDAVTWGEGHSDEYIYNADIMPDGGYILTGSRYTDSSNPRDLYIARTDSQGNVNWEFPQYGAGTGEKYGKDIVYLSDNGILVLYTDLDSNTSKIFKIKGNILPTGDFTYNPGSPSAGESVTFTADLSDIDGTVTDLIWQLGTGEGDPVETSEMSYNHTYSAAGTYTVTLKAYDNDGGELVVTHNVVVAEAPEDLCPEDPDKLEPGICGCGVPDTDTDGDSEADCNDNCPAVANADQTNTDDDEYGDACDDDDDNDGMPDSWEDLYPGLDPLVDDADGDLDHDGVTNYEEYLAGTSPGPRTIYLPFIPLLLDD